MPIIPPLAASWTLRRRLLNKVRRGYGRLVKRFSNANPEGWPLHMEDGVEPVFIVGSPRSGNTLLRRLLIAGGELQIGPELQGMGAFLAEFKKSAHCRWSYVCRMAWFQLSQQYEWPAFALTRAEVVRGMKAIAPRDRSAAAILNVVHSMYAKRYGGAARWGDKTPSNSKQLPLIDSVFPRARYVHALRDGVDVVHSMMNNAMAERLEDAAQIWIKNVAAIDEFKHAHPDQVLEVRYEDLVSDPSSSVARICKFLDLSWDPKMIERTDHVKDMGDVALWSHHAAVTKPVNESAVGKGRAVLDASERSAMKPMNELLTRHGYKPV